MAKGFLQRYGVDYEETYAPVARYASIRADPRPHRPLRLGASPDGRQIGVPERGLGGGHLHDPARGLRGSGPRSTSCVSSARACTASSRLDGRGTSKIDIALKRKDFTALDADECVYIKRHSAHTTIIALYVDDLLIACSSTAELSSAEAGADRSLFDTEDLGEASFILGIDIRRVRSARTISIGQSAYVTSILERHGMSDCTPVNTPMQHDHKATRWSSLLLSMRPPTARSREYQTIIGGCHVRHDLHSAGHRVRCQHASTVRQQPDAEPTNKH